MHEVRLFYRGEEQTSLDQRTLDDYRGEPVAKIALGPALIVSRAVDALRNVAAPVDEDPATRWDAIERAGEHLANDELGGLSPEDHCRLVTLTTGAPITDTRAALGELANGLRRMRDVLTWQAPGGDLEVFRRRRVRLADGREYAWVPRGRVLGVVESSNHAAVQVTWVQALAMGYSVFLRPGSEDPFTPWRLLWALQKGGFPVGRLAVVQGGHDLVPAMMKSCDRVLAYGGASAAPVYGNDARVLFNGPGSSKLFIDHVDDDDAIAEHVFESIAHAGGRKCICTSAVLTKGSFSKVFARARERLAALPLLDPLDPAARVPAWRHAGSPASPARLATREGVRFLEPDLVACDDPTRPPFGTELPGPWATWAELPNDVDPLELLRESLVVSLLSNDRSLHERCLVEPTINKALRGRLPTWHGRVGAPHKGRLSSHLFTEKSCFEDGGDR